MLFDDRFEEAGQVGGVGSRVEGSVVLEQQLERGEESDIELEPVGAGSARGVERQDLRLGADGEVGGADGEAGLASEEGNAGAAALTVAVPEHADDAALAEGSEGSGYTRLGGAEELDADGGSGGVNRLEVARIVELLNEGDGGDVERGQRLDGDLGIGDVRGGEDHPRGPPDGR